MNIRVPALLCATVCAGAAMADAPAAKWREVPFTQVKIADGFWAPRRETNRTVSIPHSLDMLEKAGNIRNMELAAAGAREGYSGPVFMDSDLYKSMEAAAYSLATHPDPALDARLDMIIAKIAAAQRPDGYINTWYEVNAPDKRFTNLRDNHELYCAGHMFEAAVAHFQATGKRNFLNVATKYADLIDATFGPRKRMGYPGHPEIELALVKLARATGNHKYFDLARFFVENRGSKFFATEHHTPLDRYDGTYWQDNVPIREHKAIVGHAVRAGYLMSGVTDVVSETGDEGLRKMLNRVWRNTTERNMYLTGGIGPSASNEGFTTDYDLPNLTAYQETCASVAMIMWNHRLNLLTGDAKYADVMERALYNGFLSGVSLDGTHFFYVNPLESQGGHHRAGWYSCACCPPNVTRTLAALGGYAYAASDDSITANLYIQGAMEATVGGKKVTLDVKTEYPWDGDVTIRPQLGAPATFTLRLRIPEWCSSWSFLVGGAAQQPTVANGYISFTREWKSGDEVKLRLQMPARRIAANPNVKDDAGLLAVQRGPLVYCLEQVDQQAPVHDICLPADAALRPERRSGLLGGITVLTGFGESVGEPADWGSRLYAVAPELKPTPVTLIPYYAWDNRKPGEMRVWLPLTPPPAKVPTLEGRAQVSLSFTSGNCQPWGINDGIEPKSSGEQPRALCHWWPHKGTEEWVQYTWKKPVTVAGSKVYWFDDTGRGECRLPASWRLEYRENGQWRPVQAAGEYAIAKDRWIELKFAPVKTDALRLVLKLQLNWAAGIHEWKVEELEED